MNRPRISGATPCRILIVEDHPIFRFGLRNLLSDLENSSICGEAADAPAALQAVRETGPDLVLLDIRLPGGNGLDLIRPMRAARPGLKIVVVSADDDRKTVARAVVQGARGYVTKDKAWTVLLDGLRAVLDGGLYLCPPLASDRLLRNLAGATQELLIAIRSLTGREAQVFREMGRNHSAAEISVLLNLSVKTLETHRAHMKEKLSIWDGYEFQRLASDCAIAFPRLPVFEEARDRNPFSKDSESTSETDLSGGALVDRPFRLTAN